MWPFKKKQPALPAKDERDESPIIPVQEFKTFDWSHYQAVSQGGMHPAYQDEYNFVPLKRVLKSLYAREPWINVNVNAIARQFMRCDHVLEMKTSDTGDKQVITRHPLLTFLSTAGRENGAFFTSNNIIDLVVTGDAYAWISPDVSDKRRLPAERVDINYESGRIKSYEITDIGGDIGFNDSLLTLSPDEVLHFKMPNPFTDLTGLSLLVAINLPVLIDKYGREHIIGFFLRGGHVSGIIETDASNTDQLTRFAKSVMSAIGGRRNAHADKILPKGAKWSARALTFGEIQLAELLKSNETFFRAALGTTNTVLGIAENVNRATAIAEMENFWRTTVLPLQLIYCSAIKQSSLWRRFGLDDRYTLAFDNSHIEYLDDFDRRLDADAKLKSVATINERRERLGLPVIERFADKLEVELKPQGVSPFDALGLSVKSDKSSVVQTLIFSKLEFKTADDAKKWARDHGYSDTKVDETADSFRLRQRDPEEFDQTSFRTIDLAPGVQAVVGHLKDTKALPVSALAAFKAELPKLQEPNSKAENYFHREFAHWEDITLAHLDDLEKARKLISERAEKFARGFADIALPEMTRVYDAHLKRVRTSKSMARRKDDRETQLDELRERGLRVLEGVAFENGKKRFYEYSSNNMDRIHGIIAEELAAGKNLDDVAVTVRAEFGEFYTGQAKTIVRTEFASAMARASYQFGKDLSSISKRITKTWFAMIDEHTREKHADLDNASVTGDADTVPDEPFTLGGASYLRYPKDEKGKPEDVINCRCDLIWDVEEWAD